MGYRPGMIQESQYRLTTRTLGPALRRKAGLVLRRAAARLHDPHTEKFAELRGELHAELERTREDLRSEIVR